MEGLSPGLCDSSDHGKRQSNEEQSMCLAQKQAILDIASPLHTSRFILGKLLTHSESQLVLFLKKY